MTTSSYNRRDLAALAGALAAGLGTAGAVRAQPNPGPSAKDLGISRDNAAIHQETVFKAPPERIYSLLTQGRMFDKVVELSGAIEAMHLKPIPATIGAAPGDAFALFGGYITGRHLELSPGKRIVQAWRSSGWPPHIYSIARFELSPDPHGARLLFDHTGFPQDQAVSLATGWIAHYWEPMAKALAV